MQLLLDNFDDAVVAGKAIKNIPRDQVIISSKWGPMMDEQFNFTHNAGPENARKALQTTLKNLGVDYIDLYILRSKGTTHSIEDSVKGMAVSALYCLLNFVPRNLFATTT